MLARVIWSSHTTPWVGAEMGANLSAVDLGPNRTAVSITLGYFHSCAILVRSRVEGLAMLHLMFVCEFDWSNQRQRNT